MEQAAECWGKNHDELLTQLCLHIANSIYGEDCTKLLKTVLSNNIANVDQLQELSELNLPRFQSAFAILTHKRIIIISTDPFEINFFAIFNTVLYPHFIQYAEAYAPIPQYKEYISIITRKVLDEPTLNAEKLVNSLCSKNPELEREKFSLVINILLEKDVLETDEEENIKFNFGLFLITQRAEALEKLVELNDRRILEVVRALFSNELYQGCLQGNTNQAFDQENDIPIIMRKTGLSRKEIACIFDILRTSEYSIISPSEDVLTPSNAMKSFKMKKIAQLLSEIGYPRARRVINLLLKKESLEGRALCETILMTSESGRELLERLKYLGILESEPLQDAPHTKLRRQYVIWKLNHSAATNNASSYLIGVIAKLYYDLQTEERNLESNSATKNQPINEKVKKFNEKTEILQNTMLSVTKRYIEINEL